MAGYSGTPLIKKLGIKENFRIALVNAPNGFRKELGKLPSNVAITSGNDGDLDLVLFFVKTKLELTGRFAMLASLLVPNGMLWIAWPKKSSGVATDLSFDPVQKTGLDAGLVDTKICAIDEVWSGLKFVYRKADRARVARK